MSSLTVRSVFVRFPSHPDSIEVITNGALGWLAGRQSVGRFPSLSEVGLGSRPTEKRCQRQLPKLSPASRVPSVKSPKRGQRTHCTSESVFKLIQNPSGIFMLQNPSQGLEFKSNELGKLKKCVSWESSGLEKFWVSSAKMTRPDHGGYIVDPIRVLQCFTFMTVPDWKLKVEDVMLEVCENVKCEV